MSNQPKIICISLGSIGKRHVRNVKALLPDAQIALYRQHVKDQTADPDVPIDIILNSDEDIEVFGADAAIISSPASAHIKWTNYFTEKNIPVFVEKPLCTTFEDTNELSIFGDASDPFVMVGYVLRFLPALHKLKEIISSDLIGEVRMARVEVGQYLPDWRPDTDYRAGVSAQKNLGGGAILELSHEIDYATWLFGYPGKVSCTTGLISDLELDVEDHAVILFDYPEKKISIHLDFLQRVPNMAVQLIGSRGNITADMIKEKITHISPDYPEGREVSFKASETGNEIYLRQFDFFFYKSLKGYTPIYPETENCDYHSTLKQAKNVMALVDLSKQSAQQGKRLSFNVIE